MRCNAVFSSSAAKEIQESFDWYENRADGLGYQFIANIDKIIELILLNPEVFPNKKAQYREAALKKFPYLIIYEYEKETSSDIATHDSDVIASMHLLATFPSIWKAYF